VADGATLLSKYFQRTGSCGARASGRRLPNDRNGPQAACRMMGDKITTVPKTKVGAFIGRLDDEDILRLDQAVLVFRGLAASRRTRQEV
jgi:mRNA-degrading endonuclease toxin of MazEF toxin-antitoxin module